MLLTSLGKVSLVVILAAIFLGETHAALLDRLLLMMMKNRRRQYATPFANPFSISPISSLGGSLNSLYSPFSLSSLASSLGSVSPYSQYLASLSANYGGLPPISPLGPWGGINPLYPYMSLADYPDYRSLSSASTIPNYLSLQALPSSFSPLYAPPIQAFPLNAMNAMNTSDTSKDDKKMSTRAAGLTFPVQGSDRRKLFNDWKYLANHRLPLNYRPPYLFPAGSPADLIESLS
ncbi:uncharacterized protein LOC141853429 [Brevipalpus obovatus]|uniref:uncharacterized protein LOC141853429 n=1 Tax=Brevipalpus obovatus TaxID=246614 RepID=UPI003D9F6ABD